MTAHRLSLRSMLFPLSPPTAERFHCFWTVLPTFGMAIPNVAGLPLRVWEKHTGTCDQDTAMEVVRGGCLCGMMRPAGCKVRRATRKRTPARAEVQAWVGAGQCGKDQHSSKSAGRPAGQRSRGAPPVSSFPLSPLHFRPRLFHVHLDVQMYRFG